MKISLPLAFLLLITDLISPHAVAAESGQPWSYVGRCASQEGRSKVQGNDRMEKAFREAARLQGNQKVEVYSCYRSQGRQNEIRAARGCRPYGNRDCRGSIASKSQHTYGIAADMRLKVRGQQVCSILNQVRTLVTGGNSGGVGGYGGTTGHFDLRPTLATWNICRGGRRTGR